ncbi:MAG TPA: LptF/LptG family permease [bacterium]|nr:LptF/LptG family permease [bacterium]
MKTLHKYILGQQIAPFLFGIFIIIFVLILDFLYKNLEMLIGKGVPILVSAELLTLSLGWMIVMAIPMAVLVGTLISFMRLASDNEIVAMKTSGLSLFAISKPLLIASLFLSLAMLPVHNYVVPETNHRLANLLVSIHRKKPALELREGVFANDIKGFSILAEKVKGNAIEGVTISKLVEDKPAQTIRAERGEISFADDGTTLVLKLYNGEIHDVDEKDPKRYLRLKFTEHTLNIPDAGARLVRVEREYRGEREMSINALAKEIGGLERKIKADQKQAKEAVEKSASELAELERAASAGQGADKGGKMLALVTSTQDKLQNLKGLDMGYRRSMRSYSVEVHKKIALSFACAVFVLLGIPLGSRTKEGGTGAGMAASISVFAIYYAFLTGGEKLADRGFVPPFLAMWAANILLGALGLWLFVRADKELPIIPNRLRALIGRD